MVRFAIVLTGTIDELNKPPVEAMIRHLRQFSPDSQHTLERIEGGSIVLVFRANQAVFLRLQMWFPSDYNPRLLGMSIKQIYLLPTDAAQVAPSPASSIRAERKRFLDAAPLYFALDEVLGSDFMAALAAYLNLRDIQLRKATVKLLLDLVHFSEAALPMVLAALTSADSALKSLIVHELRNLGAEGYAAVAALVTSNAAPQEVIETIGLLAYRRPARVAANILAVLEVQDVPIYHGFVFHLIQHISSGKAMELDVAALERVVWSLARLAKSGESEYDRTWAIDCLSRLHRMNSSVRRALRLIATVGYAAARCIQQAAYRRCDCLRYARKRRSDRFRPWVKDVLDSG